MRAVNPLAKVGAHASYGDRPPHHGGAHAGHPGKLGSERDIWVSTSHPERGPHQGPLWFWWDGQAAWMCPGAPPATARNAREEPRVRLALPDTYDVVLLEGEARGATARGTCPRMPRTPSRGSLAGIRGWRRAPSCTCV